MSFVSSGTHIYGDKTSQLPVHIFKLIMNEYYLSSAGFKSISVGSTMHGSSFKNRHFVPSEILPTSAKELLKLNNTINRLEFILYYS